MTPSLVQPKMLGGKPRRPCRARKMPPAYQPVRAPRGAALSCKGWQQEAVLRMLLNSLDPDVAERPQELVISGAAGKAAADWDSVQAIVASLRQLGSDESLARRVRQTRRRVAAATPHSARVLRPMHPAAKRLAIGCTQARKPSCPCSTKSMARPRAQHFGGTLAGKLVVGAGMGGAGGAQAAGGGPPRRGLSRHRCRCRTDQAPRKDAATARSWSIISTKRCAC